MPSRLPLSTLLVLSALGATYASGRVAEGPARQDQPQRFQSDEAWSNQDEDPPSWVARLNFTQGPVSFKPGELEDWSEATLNYPLRGGDHLWVDEGGSRNCTWGPTPSAWVRTPPWPS